MMIIVDDLEQGSEDWFNAKYGIPSASKFISILTMTGATGGQKKYMYTLAGQKLAQSYGDSYTSVAMQRGIDMESEAKDFYRFITGNDVKEIGLIYNNDKKECLCSPDGLIVDTTGKYVSGIEIKCPEIHTHVEYLHKKRVPPTYYPQVQGSMYITGFDTWDFMSYYPGLEPLILTVEKDEEWQKKFGTTLKSFLVKLDNVLKELT